MVILNLAIRWQELLPSLVYHHILMFFLGAGIILAAMTVAGCSSYPTMTKIFVLGIAYNNSTTAGLDSIQANISDTLSQLKGPAQLEVRVGYFGICARQNGVLWLCSSDASDLAQQIGGDRDPLALIDAASKFKDNVLFSGILLMAIAISFVAMALLTTFPGWHKEKDEQTGSLVDVKPFPSKAVSNVVLGCSSVSSVLLLIASLWQHIGCVGAAAMADSAYFKNVKTEIGSNAMILTWVSFSLTTVSTIGTILMIISIAVLDRAIE